MVASIAAAGCPTLITLSVVGLVDMVPAHPYDQPIAAAFNAHQTRDTGHGQLLGPDGVYAAASVLKDAGCTIRLTPTTWRLDSGTAPLLREWLEGWVTAACEQEPSVRVGAAEYVPWRLQQLSARQLTVTVHHRDLLVLP